MAKKTKTNKSLDNKKIKTRNIIITVISIVLVVAAVSVAAIAIYKKNFVRTGAKSAEEVAKIYFEAFSDCDEEKLNTLCPDIMGEEIEISNSFEEYEQYNANITDVKITESTDYTEDELKELKDNHKEIYGVDADIQAATYMMVSYHITMNIEGEDVSEDMTQEMVAIKYDGRWYLYN